VEVLKIAQASKFLTVAIARHSRDLAEDFVRRGKGFAIIPPHARNLCVGLIGPVSNVSMSYALFAGNELGGPHVEAAPAWISNLPFPSENARSS
jgi:hypothetical protein